MSEFKTSLEKCFREFSTVVSTDSDEWTVKGFIDVYKHIYTISTDTKVVSKIIELMIFPVLAKFAHDNEYKIVLARHQNHYPDLTFHCGSSKTDNQNS
ncbi:MAG: type II restriction endonuclease [bacterium]